ncbi:MAG: hypothetical protein Q9160_003396 [Pyrenula sp. 1 TL-2023]
MTDHISYSALAEKSKLPERQLKGVIRMAIAGDFLSEPIPGHVSHNRKSANLVTEKSFMEWARFMTNSSAPTAAKFPEATQRWGNTQAKNETAYQLANNTDLPFFDHLKQSEVLTDQFASYMKNVTASEGTSISHLLSGFDWASLEAGAKIVDVGGSSGHGSIAIARAYPDLKFVVQDLPETIAKCDFSKTQGVDNGISSRVSFMPHDFFQPQPVTDADVYLLRMIIHDWPDGEALKILRHIVSAMKPGALILIMDTVLPESGSIMRVDESRLRVRDLTMMQVFNAKERENDDWRALIESAGLQIRDVRQPEGSVMSIMKLVKQSDQQQQETRLNGVQLSNKRPEVTNTGLVNGVRSANGVNGVNGANGSQVYDDHAHPADTTTTNGLNGYSEERKDPVLIIGAGIGGLCLAQGLKKAAVNFEIYERDQSAAFRAQGYRLKIEATGDEALRTCLPPEVYQKFLDSCAIFSLGETDFNAVSGELTRSRQGSGLAGGQGLKPARTADRTVLRSVLMSGLENHLHYGKELLRYEELGEDGTVIAHFSDGSSVRGSLLVGADGARSVVRRQYLPEQRLVDTGACCIYGKTPISADLLKRFPAKGLRWMTICSDTAPTLQSVLIEESPLTLLAEPIRFDPRSKFSGSLPADYVYWVLIARKEMFAETESELTHLSSPDFMPSESAQLSLQLTKEWEPGLRSLFELQDVQQCSTLRVASALPDTPAWAPSRYVTLLGDAIHLMSPCGGVGANTALGDAKDLTRIISNFGTLTSDDIGEYEKMMRARATISIMRSFIGSKKMFNQQPFSKCPVLDL